MVFGLSAILLVALSACGAGTGAGDVTPPPTPTPAEVVMGGGGVSPAGDEEDVDQPDPGSPDTSGQPDGVSDICLIGTWVVDEKAFREYMTNSMNVSDEAQFEFGEIEGNFEMVIDEDTMTYISTDLMKIDLTLSAAGMELATLEMQIVGAGGSNWVTYEDLFIVYGQDYNFFGEGMGDMLGSNLFGQTALSVTLTPEMFVSMASFTNIDISHVLEIYPQIENYAVATYTCEGDVFTYQFGDYQAVWLRK
jgi:hypothetical protein